MIYEIGLADSDSVNLGSNPSSPANDSVDETAISAALGVLEQSDKSERTAHIARTEVGTMDWFERLTGFRETSYDDTRAKLKVQGSRASISFVLVEVADL